MLPSEILQNHFYVCNIDDEDIIEPFPYVLGAIIQSFDELTIVDYTTVRCTLDIFINQINPHLESHYFSGKSTLLNIFTNLPKIKSYKVVEILELAERNAMQE